MPKENDDGTFSIEEHECDSGAFYDFEYDAETKTDKNLE